MILQTTGDLITFALRASGINGVGQTPSFEDANTGLALLQLLIAQWQRKRWFQWHEQETSKVSTGNQWYTIAPGQDFDVARPDRIHAAWCRLQPFGGPNPVDISLAIIEAKEDWAQIPIKDLKSIPSGVFYDSAFPVGKLTFWPVPIANDYELHIVTKGGLPVYTTLVDPLGLPDEYLEAAMWSLCVRLQMSYGLPARPDHAAAMTQAVNVVQMANEQQSLLQMPAGLGGPRGTDYSSWIGRGLDHAWTTGGGCVVT